MQIFSTLMFHGEAFLSLNIYFTADTLYYSKLFGINLYLSAEYIETYKWFRVSDPDEYH